MYSISRLKVYSSLVLLALMVYGCRPSDNEFIDEYDLVFTTYDTNFSFDTRYTYYMPDTVVIPGPEGETEQAHRWDPVILQSIRSYMYSLGWELLEPGESENADMWLTTVVTSTTFSSCVVPCVNCGWGLGWGWGFPPVMSCSSFSTGSLYVVLSDPNNPDEIDNEIPVAWAGVINGLLLGSEQGARQRIENNISQMFLQSPYLKKEL